MIAYQTATRWFRPNARVDMFAEHVTHAVANYGRFPTICGVAPKRMSDHPRNPTYRWEFGDWREGVTCKKCRKLLAEMEG